jgi:DNA topoisomerase-3
MKRFVDSLARQKGLKPPRGYTSSGAACRAFLDQHAPKNDRAQAPVDAEAGKPPPAHRTVAKSRPPAQRHTYASLAGIEPEQSSGRGKSGRKAAAQERKVSTGEPLAKQRSQTVAKNA